MPGAGLAALIAGRPRLIRQPSSRTGENPPYGMSGGIEETSASFEARYAPRSYPTGSVIGAKSEKYAALWRQAELRAGVAQYASHGALRAPCFAIAPYE